MERVLSSKAAINSIIFYIQKLIKIITIFPSIFISSRTVTEEFLVYIDKTGKSWNEFHGEIYSSASKHWGAWILCPLNQILKRTLHSHNYAWMKWWLYKNGKSKARIWELQLTGISKLSMVQSYSVFALTFRFIKFHSLSSIYFFFFFPFLEENQQEYNGYKRFYCLIQRWGSQYQNLAPILFFIFCPY